MKILILTCNTGEGHNQTSKALIHEFNALGHECNAVDSLNFLSEKKSKFLCLWHLRLYRYFPRISSIGYSIIDKNPAPLEKEGKWLYNYFAKGAHKLYELIKKEGYDTVISVHPFSAVILSGLKQKYKEKIKGLKTAFVATDYTCSPGAASGDIDTYFIPHPSLKDAFVDRGIEAEKLVPLYGIPIRNDFFSAPSKEEAKRMLSFDEKEKVVLLTCGSMGCGPISKLSELLSRELSSERISFPVRLVVVCGTNKALYKKLLKKKLKENVTVMGYTNQMLLYSAAADVYITKPGGIS